MSTIGLRLLAFVFARSFFLILGNTINCNLFSQTKYIFVYSYDGFMIIIIFAREVVISHRYRCSARELKLFVYWTCKPNDCHSRILNCLFHKRLKISFCSSGMQSIPEFNYESVTTSLSPSRDFSESSEYRISIFAGKTGIFTVSRESLVTSTISTGKWDFNTILNWREKSKISFSPNKRDNWLTFNSKFSIISRTSRIYRFLSAWTVDSLHNLIISYWVALKGAFVASVMSNLQINELSFSRCFVRRANSASSVVSEILHCSLSSACHVDLSPFFLCPFSVTCIKDWKYLFRGRT